MKHRCKGRQSQERFCLLFSCFIGFADERNRNLFARCERSSSREDKVDAQKNGEFLKQDSRVSWRAELSAQVEGSVKTEIQLSTRMRKQGIYPHRGRRVGKNGAGPLDLLFRWLHFSQ